MIGERIKELREQKGLTQGELAALIGNDGNTISRWERNKIGVGNKYIAKLSKTLGVPVSYLMELEDGMQKEESDIVQASDVENLRAEQNLEHMSDREKDNMLYFKSGEQEVKLIDTPENKELYKWIVSKMLDSITYPKRPVSTTV